MSQEFIPNPDNNPEHPIPGINLEDLFPKEQPVQHILKGPRQAVTNTIHTLSAMGYAQASEWSPLQPTGMPGEVITIITKYWMLR
ncbi:MULTISPECIES: hypothetical protein [Moorena]|uniref:Uncharacterized protein n=1 Tax=Moorena producens 3L TaxID=489825 RepID=F4XSW9_9CYAN|nr:MULTISPECIES: hypothetical protein [Moorena]NEP52266.1 hypothetical protein [Moorena sp. SIO3C2]NEQ17609.1 hypothetical protein [Moorena sp. SIO3E2]EGJ32309.1 hypothetical protein LYNGBM3L_26450 [Moorena producens 3L]NEP30545.1 hypothetical protein [Moorena sp. SIO3B2]NEP65950.1 hypothetical protein [Moorena sp. SIO3A5]